MSSSRRRGLSPTRNNPVVEAREREIERLNRSLEGGRPHDVVSLEAKNRSNERLISHLNLQVDYLQQTNQELEDRIKELDDGKMRSVEETSRLNLEIDRLHSELHDIDRLAQQLEREKQEAVDVADREIQEAQMELRQSHISEQGRQSKLLDIADSNDRLSAEIADLQSENNGKAADVERLSGLLDKLQEDKSILSDKVQTLQSNEKTLVLELERYRTSPSRARRLDKSPSKLDGFIRTLEQERDHYRDECDLLQSMLRESKKLSGAGDFASSGSKSPCRSPCRTPKKSSSSKSQRARKLGDVEKERDYYKRELGVLKAITTPRRKCSGLETRKPGQTPEYAQVVKERDELQIILNKFERHMAEIQSNVKVLTQERDKTNILYDQANDELQRLRRECVRSPKSVKTSLTAQAILRRVESERDSSMSDLRRMTTERDCLRERLKVQQDQSIGERARLEQRANDLECKVCALSEERADLEGRLDSLKELNISQDADIKVLRSKLKQTEEDLQITNCELEDTRSVKNQLEATANNLQRQLSRKSSELHSAEDRIRGLEDRISEQNEIVSRQNSDITNLRATTTSLDREKDGLQVSLDERTERAVALEDQLARRERELADMRVTISDLEAKLDRAGDDLASSEREVRSLRRQLDSSQAELGETNRLKDNLTRDGRRMQDDLSTMTRENQDVNIELEELMRSRDDLKQIVQERDTKICTLENALSSKERELQDVLEQYRKVTAERDAAESRYRVMKEEAQTLRDELSVSDTDRNRLQEDISTLEREVGKHLQAQQSYEQQISCLTSQIATLEGECDRIRAERTILQSDLSSVRDLNAKCESTKDHISRQLSAKNVEHEQLHSNYEDLSRELEIVHKHLETERVGNKNLEDLMATSREKEFQAQLNAQEQKSEGQLLRDKLALNESKLQSMSREIAALRDRSSQLDAELDVTKRHLTNERYEREKAVQELRRHGMTSPSFGLSRYSSRAHSPNSRPRSISPTHRVTFSSDSPNLR